MQATFDCCTLDMHFFGDCAGVDLMQLALMVCPSLPSTSEYCTEDTQRWSQLILTVNMIDSHYEALYVNHEIHVHVQKK